MSSRLEVNITADNYGSVLLKDRQKFVFRESAILCGKRPHVIVPNSPRTAGNCVDTHEIYGDGWMQSNIKFCFNRSNLVIDKRRRLKTFQLPANMQLQNRGFQKVGLMREERLSDRELQHLVPERCGDNSPASSEMKAGAVMPDCAVLP